MTNAFDPDWPHGHLMGDNPARIIATDLAGTTHPIVAAVTRKDGCEITYVFTKKGVSALGFPSPNMDLRNAPAPKRRVKGYLNVYPQVLAPNMYLTREEADRYAGSERIACINVEVEEGEGL